MQQVHLTKGMLALVDDEDYQRVMQYKWSSIFGKRTNAYAVARIKNDEGKWRMIYLHHFVLGKRPDKGLVVDHINGCSMDNQKENLRIVTQKQNVMNRAAHRREHYKGISPSSSGRFAASIFWWNRNRALGTWMTAEAAALAYNKAALTRDGRFARLNKLPGGEPITGAYARHGGWINYASHMLLPEIQI